MKKIILLTTIFLFILIYSCKNTEKKSNELTDSTKTETIFNQNKEMKLMVYYFFSTHRCPTCISIEENINSVLNDNFKNELEKGVIKFQALNIDEKENTKIVEKYKIYGSSLIMISQDKEKEKTNDLTEFSFTYSRNQSDYFKKHIQDTINYLIK